MEKDEVHLKRLCEKWKSFTWSQRGEKSLHTI